LLEARTAVDGSKNKEELLNAVENLANALRESQRLKERPIQEIVYELNAFRWYCEKAAEHMKAAEGEAPVAVRLLKKGLPIIDERIKAKIAEIQDKAKQICQITRSSGTEYEAFGIEINKVARSISSEDPVKIFRCSTRIASQLKDICNGLPEHKKQLAFEVLEEINLATDLSEKLEKIELALVYVLPIVESSIRAKDEIMDFKDEIRQSKTVNIELHDETRKIILQRIKENQRDTIEAILKATREMIQPDPQLNELLKELESVISELEKIKINNSITKDNVDNVKNILKDPMLDFKLKLQGTVPLIPSILGSPSLSGGGEIEFSSGVNLRAAKERLQVAWDGLASRFLL
jgi:hypothetical protein